MDIALSFFKRLGGIAESCGVRICLEPSPPRYGSNFMTTSVETAQVVEQLAHPAIKMQFDTGALTVNGEDAASVLNRGAHLIGHIHASEPSLLPFGDGETDHNAVYAALQQYLPAHLVCIEMRATKSEPHLVAIDRALNAAIRVYRP